MGCGASAVAPEGHVQEDTSSDAKQSAPHRRADDHLKMQDNTDGAAVNRKHELKRSQTSVGVPERRQSDTAESYHGGANFPQEVEITKTRPRSMSLQPASSLAQLETTPSFSRVSVASSDDDGDGSAPSFAESDNPSPTRKTRKNRSMSVSGLTAQPVLRFTGYVQAGENRVIRKRGQIVMSAPQNEVEIRARLQEMKTSDLPVEEAELVLGTIRGHFLFNHMNTSTLMQVVSSMEKIRMTGQECVVEQGQENAEHMYIVCDGACQVEVTKVAGEEPVKVARLMKGAAFGEMALLHNTQRTATVRCIDEGHVFRLSRAAYQLAMMEEGGGTLGNMKMKGGKKEDGSTLEKIAPWVFDSIGDTAMMSVEVLKDYKGLLKAASDFPLEAGEHAFSHTAERDLIGPALILVGSGELDFKGDPNKAANSDGLWRVSALGDMCADTTLTEGDVLGIGSPGDEGLLALAYMQYAEQQAKSRGGGESFKSRFRSQNQLRLLGGSRHRCSVRAITQAHLHILPLKNYMCILPISDHFLGNPDAIRSFLLNSPWCRYATSKEIDRMAYSFTPAVVKTGVEVVTIGAASAHVTLVLSGTLSVLRSRGADAEAVVCECASGDVLGERSVATGEPSLVTARANEPCVVLQLPRDEYRALNLAGLNERATARGLAAPNAQLDQPRVAGASDATLNSFSTVAVVGQGAFASVGLVQHQASSEIFVMKKMNRNHIVASKMQKQIVRERLTLGLLDHPNIAKLYATFTSAESLFMLLEPCMGGELYCYMREVHALEELPTSFYIACVVAALDHMHTHNIMYRDLKPENLVIAANGYAKVVDFGFAKRTRSRTYTLCGTPEYLAPELILMKGHGTSVDWWALGVLLYEMLLGAAPFIWIMGEPHYNLPPADLYRNILNPGYEFHMPQHLSHEVVLLIRHLLTWHPLRRLGCLTDGTEDVKQHEFFAGARIDWKAMHEGTVEPPRKPALSSMTDTANFDEAYTDDNFFNEGLYVPEPDAWDLHF